MKILETDCLVIGSGIAGCTYACRAAKEGLNVMMLSQKAMDITNSDLAQGGIILTDEEDIDLLVKDVATAGVGISNERAVRELSLHGSALVEDLFINTLKTPFDKDKNGKPLKTLEGAHSKPRIIYSKDTTGHAMLRSIQDAVEKEKNITVLENNTAVDLLTLSHSSANKLDRYSPLTCFGAYIMDNKTREIYAVKAKKTILATGGLGQIYRHTTNSTAAYGQGIAMAYRVGARVINMEYVQFHPTVFAKGRSFLISEAVRGEGGVLINRKGEAFMKKYDQRGDLAPRDIVARAIEEERLKTGADSVFIDLSKLSAAHIKERFPNIYKNCLEHGVDITKEAIPVVPAAHYFCGGVFASTRGRTNIANLNAVGECACTGYHGANRLASTSLLEAVAMADLCALEDAADVNKTDFYMSEPKTWESPDCEPDINLLKQDMQTLKNTMWNYVGLMRTHTHLNRAEKMLRHLKNEIDVFYKDFTVTPELLNLRNGTQTGLLIIYAALKNKTSLGCHFLAK